MLAPLHSVIDREEHEMCLFKFLQLRTWKYVRFTCDNTPPYDKARGQLRFVFSVVNNVLSKTIA